MSWSSSRVGQHPQLQLNWEKNITSYKQPSCKKVKHTHCAGLVVTRSLRHHEDESVNSSNLQEMWILEMNPRLPLQACSAYKQGTNYIRR